MLQIFTEILRYIMHVFIDIYLLLNILLRQVMPFYMLPIVMDKHQSIYVHLEKYV